MQKFLLNFLIIGFVIFLNVDKAISDENKNNCPSSLSEIFSSIKNHLKEKKWIYITFSACPQIQDEIVKKADQLIHSKDFDLLIPLMHKRTMRIVRNTFFAVRGYSFKDLSLKEHFMTFQWYKPTKSSELKFTKLEIKRINQLNSIEKQWEAEASDEYYSTGQPRLPSNLNIIEDGKKRYLKLNEINIDITPEDKSFDDRPGYSIEYSIRDIPNWNSVLICQEMLPNNVDTVDIRKMELYSNEGKRLSVIYGPDNERCPIVSPEMPNALIRYADVGCCGRINDTLYTFDKGLNIISGVDCGGHCVRTRFFYEASQGDLFYYVVTGVAAESIKDNVYSYLAPKHGGGKRTSYSYKYSKKSYDKESSEPKKFVNKKIFKIKKNGVIIPIAEERNNCEITSRPINNERWWYKCDGGNSTVVLYPEPLPTERLSTSIQLGDKLILFWANPSYKKEVVGTTIVPLYIEKIKAYREEASIVKEEVSTDTEEESLDNLEQIDRLGQTAIIVNNNLYTTINTVPMGSKYGLNSWPSPEIKKLSGKDAWGKWSPKIGNSGRIVHQTTHSDGNRVFILQIGKYYVPVSADGVEF